MAAPVFLEMVHGGHCKVRRQPWGFLALPLSPTVTCLSQSSSRHQPCAVLDWAQEANSPLSSCWPSKLGPNRRGLTAAGSSACLPSPCGSTQGLCCYLGWPAVPGARGNKTAAVFLPEQSLLLTGRGLAPQPSGEWAGCEVWLQNSGSGVCKTTRPSCSSCRGPRRAKGWPSSSLHRSLLERRVVWAPESINYGQKKNHSAW